MCSAERVPNLLLIKLEDQRNLASGIITLRNVMIHESREYPYRITTTNIHHQINLSGDHIQLLSTRDDDDGSQLK